MLFVIIIIIIMFIIIIIMFIIIIIIWDYGVLPVVHVILPGSQVSRLMYLCEFIPG